MTAVNPHIITFLLLDVNVRIFFLFVGLLCQRGTCVYMRRAFSSATLSPKIRVFLHFEKHFVRNNFALPRSQGRGKEWERNVEGEKKEEGRGRGRGEEGGEEKKEEGEGERRGDEGGGGEEGGGEREGEKKEKGGEEGGEEEGGTESRGALKCS